MADFDLIVDVLQDVFGEWKNHNSHSGQISFDCPTCSFDIKGLDKGDGKGNLEINYKKNIYKCWACSDTNNTKGRLHYLMGRWGTPQQKKIFKLAVPEKFKDNEEEYDEMVIPQGFTSLLDGNKLDMRYKEAINYLTKRGITKEYIKKYKLGYTITGKYSHRIIFPSYDKEGELNYFVARSYVKTKLKYKNPKVQKENIIFNEDNINWNEDIYLVEGVFDMIFLPNAIPLLGKTVSEYLWSEIYKKATANIIICLDGDAWSSTEQLFNKLNGGRLHKRIKVLKLPKDKDIGDLKGDLSSLSFVELEKK